MPVKILLKNWISFSLKPFFGSFQIKSIFVITWRSVLYDCESGYCAEKFPDNWRSGWQSSLRRLSHKTKNELWFCRTSLSLIFFKLHKNSFYFVPRTSEITIWFLVRFPDEEQRKKLEIERETRPDWIVHFNKEGPG